MSHVLFKAHDVIVNGKGHTFHRKSQNSLCVYNKAKLPQSNEKISI